MSSSVLMGLSAPSQSLQESHTIEFYVLSDQIPDILDFPQKLGFTPHPAQACSELVADSCSPHTPGLQQSTSARAPQASVPAREPT